MPAVQVQANQQHIEAGQKISLRGKINGHQVSLRTMYIVTKAERIHFYFPAV
jgi:hypothetical protein